MEKYSFEQAENEADNIRYAAKSEKNFRVITEKEEEGEPTRDDYETANIKIDQAKKDREEAQETLKNLKNIDLSTLEGRIAVARMYMFGPSGIPEFKGPKGDKYGDQERIDGIIKNSFGNGSALPISRENLLKDLENISELYGHGLVKRPGGFSNFMMGWGYKYRDHLDAINDDGKGADKFLLSYTMKSSGDLSSQVLNCCPSMDLLIGLYEKIKEGKITEEKAKTHPNYVLVEELVLKADKQQRILSDIIFKVLSSYIHSKKFIAPSLSIDVEEKEGILKKNEEISNIILRYGKHVNERILNSVDSFSFDPELEVEIKELMSYIDFFQPILDRYNSLIDYSGPEGKDKK